MKKLILIIVLSICTVLHSEYSITIPFGSYYFPDKVQSEILDFQDELKSLTVQRTDFTSEAAYLFLSGSFPKLESLNLDAIWRGSDRLEISKETFAPNLKYLTLHHFFFSYPTLYKIHGHWEGALSFITTFKTLEFLSLYRSYNYDEFSQDSLDCLSSSLPLLKQLDLHLDFVDLDFIHFTNLEVLDLSGSSVMGSLQNLPNVKHLNLSHIEGAWGLDFRDLAALNDLTILKLSGISLTPENIEQTLLATMPNLMEWVLEGSKARGIHFSTFSPNLKSLSLKESNVTGGDMSQIALLENLEFLDLTSTALTGASLKKLAGHFQLKELILAKTNMSKVDFSQLPLSLEVLNLAESTLSISSFNSLSSLTHLKKLDLRAIKNSNITQDMIRELQDILSGTEILFN